MSQENGLNELWTECEELCQRISNILATLERQAITPDQIDSIYRDFHTIKGAAMLFGVSTLGQVAHTIESSLEPVRNATIDFSTDHLELLYRGVDLIEQLVSALRGEQPDFVKKLELKIPGLVDMSVQSIGGNMSVPKESAPFQEQLTAPIQAEAPAAQPEPVKVKAPSPTTPAVTQEDHGESSTIRVPVLLLDRLMTLMGEMVLVRNQVIQYSSRSDDLGFLNLSQRLDVVTSDIQSEMMKTRMQPIGNILSKYQRLVRDLARDLGKKIEIQLSGTETELDKTLIEAVKDPLTHIIRNACDHGMETPEERRAAGKPEAGSISVRSYHEGGQVIIEVSDNGRGLNKEKLVAKAIEKGLMTPEKAAALSEREIFNIIFLPGFSTAAKVTNVSGRGVGMDVVRSNIEKIGGIVELQSKLGEGTTIRLKIPLTLAIVPAMIVSCESDRYAIPQVKLVELLRIETTGGESPIEQLQGKSVMRLRGNLLPLLNLKQFLGFYGDPKLTDHPLPEVVNVVVLRAESHMFGLIVDEIQDTADIVVKPLNPFLKSLNFYSGATVLGDGSVALILDVMGLAQRMLSNSESSEVTNAANEIAKGDEMAKAQDLQEFLLFKLNAPSKHAIPLDLVHRLEEFKKSDIEVSGSQRVMRYRDSILPILNLNEFLNYASSGESVEREVVPVIVTRKGGRYFGIEVNEILDVLKTESPIDDSLSDRPGILGSLIAGQEVVVAVDSMRMLDDVTKANPNYIPTTSAPINFAPQPAAGASVNPTLGANRSILYAEDNAFFRRHVGSILAKAGFDVTTANNGAEALAKLESAPIGTYVAVLSDIEMPKMNGLEFATQVRKLSTWKDVPMIALTTKSESQHVKAGLQAGFNAYLEKLNGDELVDSLNQIAQRKVG